MHHRQNLILGTFVVAITFLFIALSVLNNNSSVDYYQNKIDPNKKRNLNNNHHKNTENAVDLPTRKNAGGGRIEEDTVVVVDRNKNLRGGDEERNIWVSQDSQPFVSLGGLLLFQTVSDMTCFNCPRMLPILTLFENIIIWEHHYFVTVFVFGLEETGSDVAQRNDSFIR